MKVARVIVDIPSTEVNRFFDYLIPDQFKDVVVPGIRVIVPFGRRKLKAFVISIASKSDHDSLREILDVLDVEPILTKEHLELGRWLVSKTLCFYITAYQAMLPQALKVSYDKELLLIDRTKLSAELLQLFQGKQRIPFAKIKEAQISYYHIRQAVDAGAVEIKYIVKSKATKRYETYVKPVKTKQGLKQALIQLPKNAIRQQELIHFFINDPVAISQKELLQRLKVSRPTIKALEDKNILKTYRKEVYRSPYAIEPTTQTEPLSLTAEQKTAIKPIDEALFKEKSDVFLLHGVTGSGKTEIYLQTIEKVINKGKEAIVLVPEISLTPQMVKRFKNRFGQKVAVLHSALSAGEKYDEWRKIMRQEVKVVVGARSAIFAPFTNLGIIIIDEEHEQTYKQEEQPRYHAKDVALWRARYHRCPVVLGSATPSLESYARAKKGVFHHLVLKERTNRKALPTIHVVDMRKELHQGNRSMFSNSLQEAIKKRLDHGEQIILLLNRRGYSTFIICRDCGYVAECPHCDIALTYHKKDPLLKCHYCTYVKQVPHQCPTCQSPSIRYFGTGTQRVEEALKELLPKSSIIRMDVDTTRRKGSHERLLQKFANQEADILLGTQMIAKGLDFENVTLVGVLAADSMLYLPDFRSSEKTFQLITQVSGRAGRHALPGEVIVQTYSPEHYSIDLASHYQFEAFYEREMLIRRRFQYPPYVYLTLITVAHQDERIAQSTTKTIVRLLSTKIDGQSAILGPSPSPIARLKNRYRFQCMIKYKREPKLPLKIQRVLDYLHETIKKKQITVTVDFQPYQFM